MITPDVIKKIEDQRREKSRRQDHHVPAHKDHQVPHPPQENTKKQDEPRHAPGRIVEISVV